jgi:putative hemolysin
LSIAYILIALLFTSFFAGLEIAFISANKLLVELQRKRAGSNFESTVITKFYDKPAKFLGSMLVGHNIALVTLTILLTNLLKPSVEHYVQGEFLISVVCTLIITILVLIFAEYLPKTVFRLYADTILFTFALPIRFFQFLLAAPTWIMTKLSNLLITLIIGKHQEEPENAFTRIDLEHFVKNTFKPASQEEEVDTDLFNKALQLRNVKVKQCMIPRSEMIHIDVADAIADLRKVFKDSNLSRIIVIKDDIDNILGYVHHQQMLKKPTQIQPLVMDVLFVPEVMKVLDLMDKFIKERFNIACVVDEFGGTSGIITLEDILEQIFGDIEDEHDHEEFVEHKISDKEYLFSGRLEIDYINSAYPLIHIPRGEYHTLSGYLVDAVANIPDQGSVIELLGYRFIPEIVSDTRIETVRIVKHETDN